MNIVIITDYYPPDKVGGVGEIAKNLKAAYDENGHKTYVLSCGKIRKGDRSTGIYRSSEKLILAALLNNFVLLKLVFFSNIDLVHLHQSSTTLCLPFLYLFKKRPRIINSLQVSYISEMMEIRSVKHRDIDYKPLRHELIEKIVLAPLHVVLDFVGYIFSDYLTVVSFQNKCELEATFGQLIRKNISIVANGVDTSVFTGSSTNINEASGASQVWFIYAGVFRVRKRLPMLLHALSDAVNVNPNIRLQLVGGGRGYERPLLAMIDEFGLNDFVDYRGLVTNYEVSELMARADVFCLMSSYEGMPVALLEAMASSRAVLVSNVCGMKDIIEDGFNGVMVDVDDIDATARAMIQLAEDPAYRLKLGGNARQRVVANHSWKTIANQYLDILR